MSIYQQIRAGDYALFLFTFDQQTRHRATVGSVVAVTKGDMEKQGIDLVLTQLKRFKTSRHKTGCELYTLPHVHRPRGDTQPPGVSIWLEMSDRLAIQPLNPGDGTNIFIRQETSIAVQLPVPNAEFLRILRAAFGQGV